jgi:UDP-3-O-acyl N-acetylglucosamine deacetylase
LGINIVRTIGHRWQRTLARPATIAGRGFITGSRVNLRFLPADAHDGLTFIRTDRASRPSLACRAESVTDTRRRTTLGTGANSVTLIEHCIAALAGLRIDNCTIELDGPEPPGLDGSCLGFVEVLQAAGIISQTAKRAIRTVSQRVTVNRDGGKLAIHPADSPGLRVSYILDYGAESPLPRQSVSMTVTPESFARDVAPCRTFLIDHEVDALRKQGIGTHVTAKDVLIFTRTGVLDNSLRFADEPARHKLLDLVGDLALCGFDLAGHVVAYRSGHGLNNDLARELSRQAALDAKPAPLTAVPAVVPLRRNRMAA